MDLWIRSQDRQDLIKVDGRFHVRETRKIVYDMSKE